MYSTSDDRDLLDLYIEELRGEPVLTAVQQKDLARAMRAATTVPSATCGLIRP